LGARCFERGGGVSWEGDGGREGVRIARGFREMKEIPMSENQRMLE
jgi:hypothetical protein